MVATSVGEVPNLLRQSYQGVVVPPENVFALADGLRRGLELSSPSAIAEDSTVSWRENAATMHRLLSTAVHGYGEQS